MNELTESPDRRWQAVSGVPELTREAIHVWRLKVDTYLPYEKDLLRLLDAGERRKAELFYFPMDCQRSIVSRASLRWLVGKYLSERPEAVTFSYGKSGKPLLHSSDPILHFNVSHAGNWIVLAFTKNGPLGIDVEPVNPDIDVRAIAGNFFSREEIPRLLALPEAEQQSAFFRLWTRKEALIKARGDGLSCPLDQFGVEMADVEAVRVLHTDWDATEVNRWQLRAFYVDDGETVPASVATLFPSSALQLLELRPAQLIN